MGLFQHSVLNKYLNETDQTEMMAAYQKLTEFFHNPVIQQNLRRSKEELKLGGLYRKTKSKENLIQQKQKAQSLKSEIDKTDREIDQMVYELYGLT